MLKRISLIIIMLAFSSMIMPLNTAHALGTAIQLVPQTSTVGGGTTFTVNLTVTDVTNLAVWEFRIFYNSSVLNCTGAVKGPFLETGGSSQFFTFTIYGSYNATHGCLLFGSSLLGQVPGVNGSGTLATITFQALAAGYTPLHFDNDPVWNFLQDSSPPPRHTIPYTANDGTVHVQHVVWDLDGDGKKTDMRDIAICAKAFNTRPGDPLWNPIADITGPTYLVPDGVVNMRDISLVAKHFLEPE